MEFERFLKTIIDEVLRPNGFSRRRNVWHKDSTEALLSITLSRDRYRASQFYLDLQVTLKGGESKPNDAYFLFGRDYATNVEDKIELEQCLNARRTELDVASLTEKLARLIETKGLPLWNTMLTVEGLRKLWRQGDLKHYGVSRQLQAVLKDSAGQTDPFFQ